MGDKIIEWILFIFGIAIFTLAVLGPFILYYSGSSIEYWNFSKWEPYLLGCSVVAYTIVIDAFFEARG